MDADPEDAAARARRLEEGLGALPVAPPDEAGRRAMRSLAHDARAIAGQARRSGAEDVARLALSCEKTLEYLAGGIIAAEPGIPILASSVRTLLSTLEALHDPDRPGSRGHRVPLEAARYELETLFPIPGKEHVAEGADVPVGALRRRRSDDVE